MMATPKNHSAKDSNLGAMTEAVITGVGIHKFGRFPDKSFEQPAKVSAKNHRNAVPNPSATDQKALTLKEILKQPTLIFRLS